VFTQEQQHVLHQHHLMVRPLSCTTPRSSNFAQLPDAAFAYSMQHGMTVLSCTAALALLQHSCRCPAIVTRTQPAHLTLVFDRKHAPQGVCQQRPVDTLQLLSAKHGQPSATTRFRNLCVFVVAPCAG
jgi:hypothetical protein